MTEIRGISCDGGGVFGAISATLIKRLQENNPDFIEKATILSGTSVGGILVSCLANDMPIDDIIKLFFSFGPKIFSKSDLLRKILSTIGLKAFYSNQNLNDSLNFVFGKKTLGDLRKKIIIPAFMLHNKKGPNYNWKSKFFHNLEGEGNDSHELVVDVLMSSCAVPIFFPSYFSMIDGAFAMNSPGMALVAQTQDTRYFPNPSAIKDIKLLSFGKTTTKCYIEQENLDWGYLNWAKTLINIVLDKDNMNIHYMCNNILKENYHRLACIVEEESNIGIDDFGKIDQLIELANNMDITHAENYLRNVWN